MRPVVILHGSWHRPEHFDALAAGLRRDGATVSVPDLSAPLPERIRTVQAIVDAADEPPVVVAHSLGGVTAGHVSGAHHLLFLAGWVLEVGESVGALLQQASEDGAPGPAQLGTVVEEDTTSIRPEAAVDLLFADCPAPVAQRAVALLRPELLSLRTTPAAAATWRSTPSTYVAGSEDRIMAPGLSRRFAQRCATVLRWPTSHSMYLSRPDDVRALVGRLA